MFSSFLKFSFSAPLHKFHFLFIKLFSALQKHNKFFAATFLFAFHSFFIFPNAYPEKFIFFWFSSFFLSPYVAVSLYLDL